MTDHTPLTRRRLLTGAGALGAALCVPAILRAQGVTGSVRNNVSSFQMQDWRDHFDALGQGVILADTVSRAVHYWSADGADYRMWPSSVPISEELTRRGMTEVIKKVEGPTWTPTPSMRERDPSLPAVIPAGPENPLGTHALYLSWQYYRVHGTHDTRKIGRRSSDGCIGLYNEHIAELFALARVGTKVKLI
ncbi:MAG: L,D-transpeptidase [Paracoccaceae bacterium]